MARMPASPQADITSFETSPADHLLFAASAGQAFEQNAHRANPSYYENDSR
jgi:hypothetical protein